MNTIADFFADELGVRLGGIRKFEKCAPNSTDPDTCAFETNVIFNDNFTVSFT
jgi:hypothetical protein